MKERIDTLAGDHRQSRIRTDDIVESVVIDVEGFGKGFFLRDPRWKEDL